MLASTEVSERRPCTSPCGGRGAVFNFVKYMCFINVSCYVICVYVYIYIYIYVYTHIHIHICIYVERERERCCCLSIQRQIVCLPEAAVHKSLRRRRGGDPG